MLTLEIIQETITTQWLGKHIHYRPSLPSTNDLLKEMAADGCPAGTMVLTDFQSKGKGRLNRRWEAPPGTSLLVSLLFRPNWPAQQAHWLTMIAGLAAVSAVTQETNLVPSLKWPNDLVHQVNGEWRKFGGLLLEANFENDRLNYAVLGSGINVNIPPDALPQSATPATSLLALSGQPVDRLSLLNRYLLALERLYQAAESGQSPQPAWVAQLITLGKPVRVSGRMLDAPLEGIAQGVDEWGRLLVRDGSDRLHSLSAGDVSLRG
jgi:BirA family biotin operon repressor/biotin-[acetyl-CoA-carboxylase] ligase